MDNFSYFSLKPYVVTPLLNRSDEGLKFMFYAEIKKKVYP